MLLLTLALAFTLTPAGQGTDQLRNYTSQFTPRNSHPTIHPATHTYPLCTENARLKARGACEKPKSSPPVKDAVARAVAETKLECASAFIQFLLSQLRIPPRL